MMIKVLFFVCSFNNIANKLIFRSEWGRCPLTVFFGSSRKVWRSRLSSSALVFECTADTWSNSALTGFHCFSLKLIFSRQAHDPSVAFSQPVHWNKTATNNIIKHSPSHEIHTTMQSSPLTKMLAQHSANFTTGNENALNTVYDM